MITMWDVYWITRLNGILIAAWVLFFLCVLFPIIFLAIYDCEYSREPKQRKLNFFKKAMWLWVGALMFLFIALLIPTTKKAVAIYMIPKIANNEQVQKLPDNALKFLNGKFEAWIADMTEKGKE